MTDNNFLLDLKTKLEVKLLVLSIYDELLEEIKRLDTTAYTHSEEPVDNEILIKLRNAFFILGDKQKFNELNCELYGYHEFDQTPEYRNITVYQEKLENDSVPNGKYSLHAHEHYEKIDEYVCHLPLIKIYEKSKDDHIRKYVQKYIYQTVLNNSNHYFLTVFEAYFEERNVDEK